MRSPAVVLQLRFLTHCTCTAFACSFFSCTAHTCGSSLFSMIGFGASWPGAIGAVCGILACIGSSIVMCCAPASAQEGGGKFTAVRKSTQLAAAPTPTRTPREPQLRPHPAHRPVCCSSSLASSNPSCP